MKACFALIALLAAAACGAPDTPARPPTPMQEPSPQVLREAATAFQTVRDGFLEWYYEADPVRASELGVRTHDERLTAMDRSSIQRRIGAVLDWQADLRRVPIRLMRGDDRADYAILDFALRAELLGLEEVRHHAIDPRKYTDVITRGIVAVAERPHAPAAERAEALRGRLSAAPAVLAAARENLRSPPRIWTELAIAEARGLLVYLEADLPRVMAGPGESSAPGLDPARAELVAALRGHIDWLENTLLPASTGDFRLGRYLFTRMLLYDGHVELSVQELERLNEARIAEYQGQLEAVAAEIDPARAPRRILDSIADLRPEPGVALSMARDVMTEARDWVRAADLVTIPRAGVPEVRPYPPYAVRGPTALRAPGPFDDPAAGAVYQVSVALDRPAVLTATLQETFPGDYVRRLHEPDVSAHLARVFTPRTFTDGWAQYAADMAIDQGFRSADPTARLARLRHILHGHALWHASLQLHALAQPMDRVVERFMGIAYVDEERAREEVVRVTYDPLLLAGALGRHQIIELRSAYERHQEEQRQTFSLKEFHDRILQLALPMPLATEVLMPTPPEPTARRLRP